MKHAEYRNRVGLYTILYRRKATRRELRKRNVLKKSTTFFKMAPPKPIRSREHMPEEQ